MKTARLMPIVPLPLLLPVLLFTCLPVLSAAADDSAAPAGPENAAADSPAGDSLDPLPLIGMDARAVYERLGPPLQLYTHRGASAEQDDVVFFYPQHLYLFWFDSRVWQVRFDEGFTGTVFGLRIGASRGQVREVMGRPIREEREEEQALFFHLEDRGYPVQAGFYFAQGRLVDVYCFRGDL